MKSQFFNAIGVIIVFALFAAYMCINEPDAGPNNYKLTRYRTAAVSPAKHDTIIDYKY